MAKDPAFLFYSKDFYEGTRTLLPEERACLIDLMIYQHQNGEIPNDLRRLLLYCSGIDEATLKATLEAKFKLSDGVYHNCKLREVIDERNEFSKKQSINGTIGQFWKKAKASLKAKEYRDLRDKTYTCFTNHSLYEFLNLKEGISEATLQAMLKALLKHLAIADAVGNEDVNGYKDFIIVFNKIRKSKFSGCERSKTQFNARKNDGYKIEDFEQALNAAMKEQFHIENNFKHLTPEFITRNDKFEKYLNAKSSNEITTEQYTGLD